MKVNKHFLSKDHSKSTNDHDTLQELFCAWDEWLKLLLTSERKSIACLFVCIFFSILLNWYVFQGQSIVIGQCYEITSCAKSTKSRESIHLPHTTANDAKSFPPIFPGDCLIMTRRRETGNKWTELTYSVWF